jgi:hypothetical protein
MVAGVAWLGLVLLSPAGVLGLRMLPGLGIVHQTDRRSICCDNLKQLASEVRSYASTFNGYLPAAYIADKNGKPLFSWRLNIMPFTDNGVLYLTFDHKQSWDTTARNKGVLRQRPSEFFCPSDPSSNVLGATQTNYLAAVGSNAAWIGGKGRKVTEFGNDASSTILFIEAGHSGIAWTEPRDLSVDTLGTTGENSSPLDLTSNHGRREEFFFIYDAGRGVHVAMADGSVHFLRTDCLSPEDLRTVLSIGGCKDVSGRGQTGI